MFEKICIALLSVMLVGLILFMVFYGDSITVDNSNGGVSMFTRVENTKHWAVVYHKDTKIMYTVSSKGEFTMLINADGTPMIYNEKENSNEK